MVLVHYGIAATSFPGLNASSVMVLAEPKVRQKMFAFICGNTKLMTVIHSFGNAARVEIHGVPVHSGTHRAQYNLR